MLNNLLSWSSTSRFPIHLLRTIKQRLEFKEISRVVYASGLHFHTQRKVLINSSTSTSKISCYCRFFYAGNPGFNSYHSSVNHWSLNKLKYINRNWMLKYDVRRYRSNFTQRKNQTTAIYTVALVIVVLGISYAAVPLYRMFCQASGLGGTVQLTDAGEKIKNMETRKERLLTIRFNADKSATMQWSFKPQQTEVKVYAGETALAFYTARNPTDLPITGISTYNVIPFEAGQYFNKIQCFCFEEQRLNPHEQIQNF
ncbi:cytochrome c oxidase assembly protein COX11, mitochondrial-like isoform X2 [Xenia sp. Carnegie-2017]|uniref:cytochrome c oxidase assembly protein COX11, mitochondrial-like isoform X2 n=1 Tax=Xenia sp. Carnegie-2017 TaxID=2897299 RepID=UPI001F03E829|nr:cytochrome c oxidase assembly protein COX11, mitochondrial-like isoform X2 [Xenia sp. Carnegie-2017]